MKNSRRKFWTALVLLGLIGQVAWVVENMYLNVFIYKMFSASAADISLMVSLSAVSAAATTVLMGALCDRVGKLRTVIGLGYLTWGVTILAFGLVKMDLLTPLVGSRVEAAALGVTLVIALDCLMTIFGSAANDAAYNAWLTEMGDENNRGKIEGVNAMMPLVAILVVFGGFMGFNLDLAESWTVIFNIIGSVVIAIGIACFFLVEEPGKRTKPEGSYWETLAYSFRPAVVGSNKLLYLILVAYALFCISIQTFMPYLIIYYEKSLGMTDYVLIMAPAIIIASVVTVFYGRLFDKMGFQKSVLPCLGMLLAGYVILYFTVTKLPVFIGSLLMMCGYLCGMAIFGAAIRGEIPRTMPGRFQGVRIISGVLIPGVIGPAIGAAVLSGAEQILGQDGTYSFLPNRNIWAAAIVTALVVLLFLRYVFYFMRTSTDYLPTQAAEEGRVSDWSGHPRPQCRREKFFVLTKGWTLNGSPIRVPYPPQSELSGYKGKVDSRLVYETTFSLPADFTGGRTLLHFGAVDQTCEVLVNGKPAGSHEDGYLDFTFDITELLIAGENRLQVNCTDRLERLYPYGKQTKKRGGMWYTPVSGIWQSVWLEQVPEQYIEGITMVPDLEGVHLTLAGQADGFTVEVAGKQYTFSGREGYVKVEEPHLWTPEDPWLYDMVVTAGEDRVSSYFALRTIKTEGSRLLLNDKPIFLHGVLDQGYFPDGIFLPAEEEEYLRDIRRMKDLGFNMLRKHIKIEPECFYYYCDKCGMLVMQDLVNSGGYNFLFDTALPTIGWKNQPEKRVSARHRQVFLTHMEGVVRRLGNHPSVVMYTIFNEGWGQFDCRGMYDHLKKLDPSRPVDTASGWFRTDATDFDSEHIYFKAITLPAGKKPLLLSECGGYSRAMEGHIFNRYVAYGYGGAEDEAALTEMIADMYRKMIVGSSAVGCVYTQLSDVEDEINGLYTYDRKVCKVDQAAMRALAEEIYGAQM
ncbi:MAG: MFS transporter [Ruminococcaceae bacterium]|nr:MFS transporter [Oscillospiraceae bacterium]